MTKKIPGDQNQVADMTRIRKASESILFLIVGQLAIGLTTLTLFAVSFFASPLRPLVWAQVLALAVLLIGGIALVTVVVINYRREIVRLLSRK